MGTFFLFPIPNEACRLNNSELVFSGREANEGAACYEKSVHSSVLTMSVYNKRDAPATAMS